ncbi:endogenous retrovirus group K member 7 Env polyprotein-like [Dama dama]|uniref:endogenous retrovirus group K member 7 Env polyprotein-like n=1 Tax=Dama dama TaxID=30532 RepID=UPI002A35972D|nr:endogenous retrovirus group K member 7 Env polyprotein-like [Dama dama]
MGLINKNTFCTTLQPWLFTMDLNVVEHKIAVLNALAACNYLPQPRKKIVAALFKALNSTNSELQEAGKACMKKFLKGATIKVDQIHTHVCPLLMMLGDYRSLTLNVVNRLSSQYNICSFVVLRRPTYLMVPVSVSTYWYDIYGIVVLQQLQDFMRSRRFLGLLILGISALITAITSVTVAAISLTHQVRTTQYVNDMSKDVSLGLATQEIIDKKLKVDALKKAVMHIGTKLQALKVKLRCHADYRWICVTPLKVNETDYNWEKTKNHISGVWNSSSISLDLDRLHGQIRTTEHSRLDVPAAGAASDFSNFISAESILSTVLSYIAVIALILIIIVVLPCIVRALRQSTRKLATEINLAVLKNKKGGDAGSHYGRAHP